MWQTFTNSVRKAFSDAADQYDILASLHREIGRELVKKNIRCEASRILDVGTGTGYVANKAKFFFPDSMIVGLDIAEGMIEKAAQTHEGIVWLQADGHTLPFKDKTFDRIFSNLAYQWMPDLPLAFAQARRVLTDNGSVHGTLFGFRTCEELLPNLIKALVSLFSLFDPQTGFRRPTELRLNRLTLGFQLGAARGLSRAARLSTRRRVIVGILRTVSAGRPSGETANQGHSNKHLFHSVLLDE